MASLDDHADALGFDHFLNGFGDLRGQPLLNLQPAGEQFNQPRNFAEAKNPAIGDVGHMHFAEKREQMVLAQAEHFNVFDDDHLVIIHGK